MNDVSSGTGMAGIIGNVILLALKGAGFSNTVVYFMAVPTMFVF